MLQFRRRGAQGLEKTIDLRCRMYVTTTRLADFLQAKNRLNLQIMDAVHKDGCDFAFPTTTIEMAEKK